MGHSIHGLFALFFVFSLDIQLAENKGSMVVVADLTRTWVVVVWRHNLPTTDPFILAKLDTMKLLDIFKDFCGIFQIYNL